MFLKNISSFEIKDQCSQLKPIRQWHKTIKPANCTKVTGESQIPHLRALCNSNTSSTWICHPKSSSVSLHRLFVQPLTLFSAKLSNQRNAATATTMSATTLRHLRSRYHTSKPKTNSQLVANAFPIEPPSMPPFPRQVANRCNALDALTFWCSLCSCHLHKQAKTQRLPIKQDCAQAHDINLPKRGFPSTVIPSLNSIQMYSQRIGTVLH